MSVTKESLYLSEKSLLAEVPSTLQLQLKGVQNFPGNKKVALYFCPSIKKHFSFVFDKNGGGMMESYKFPMENLKNINGVHQLIFEDGSTLNIDEVCVNRILNLYDDLSEGKDEFVAFLGRSDSNFLSILDYSINKYKKDEQ